MKNTLAENMLRFGVKNLQETEIEKLKEQATKDLEAVTVKGPVVKEWPIQIKNQQGTVKLFAEAEFDAATKTYKVNSVRLIFDAGTYKKAYTLSATTLENNALMRDPELDALNSGGSNMYDIGKAKGVNNTKKSITHFNEWLQQVNQRFKVQLPGGDLAQLFNRVQNGNSKIDTLPNQFPGTAKYFPPFEVKIEKVYDLATNQPISTKSIFIRPLKGSNMIQPKSFKGQLFLMPLNANTFAQYIVNTLGIPAFKNVPDADTEYKTFANWLKQNTGVTFKT